MNCCQAAPVLGRNGCGGNQVVVVGPDRIQLRLSLAGGLKLLSAAHFPSVNY
jgi:hypothetical protein